MNLTWWEWEELSDALVARPDLWTEHTERVNTFFRMVEQTPVYALTGMPAPGTSEFRLVKLITVPLSWAQGDVDAHLDYMTQKFTSLPFRLEVQLFLQTELGLEAQKAYQASVIIARIQQGPLLHKTDPIDYPEPGRTFYLHEGGHLRFSQQGEMLRVNIDLKSRTLGGWSFILLDGFVRPRGKSIRGAIEWLLGDGYEAKERYTYDVKSQALPLEPGHRFREAPLVGPGHADPGNREGDPGPEDPERVPGPPDPGTSGPVHAEELGKGGTE